MEKKKPTKGRLHILMTELPNLFDEFVNEEFFTLLSPNYEKITPGLVTDNFCQDCNHIGCVNKTNQIKGNFTDPKFTKFTYNFNNYCFRSDDFDSLLAEDNFLFAGCSNTFGIGMPIEFSWSNMLNKKLGKTKHFNLGVNSASADVVIHNVNVYINKIGKPKAIIMLLPDPWRFLTKAVFETDDRGSYVQWTNIGKYGILNKLIGKHPKNNMHYVSDMFESNSVLRTYQSLYALELLCKKLEIPLLWSTWSSVFNDYCTQMLSDKLYGYGNLLNEVNSDDFKNFKEISKIEKSIYWSQNREGHPNGGQHFIWSEAMYRLLVRKYPQFEN